MWVHEDPETVFSTLVEYTNKIVHIFIIIFPTGELTNIREGFLSQWSGGAYGPSCSRDSHVKGIRSRLKPQPWSLARWTSALPSSRFSGRPIKLSFP